MPLLFVVIVGFMVTGGALLIYKDELGLIFNGEGYRPNSALVLIVAGLFVAAWIQITLLGFALNTVKQDYKLYIEQTRADASPPNISAVERVTPEQAMVASYEARGFHFDSRLNEHEDSPQIWTKDIAELDESNVYRRPGVLIYRDGSATQFSVAVLSKDDAWVLGDEILVRRHRAGRPVRIETAINRPAIRELVHSSDYILGIGLASSSATLNEVSNEGLAHARAYNIGYAILKLGLRDATRVYGVSLGFATQPPSSSELEERQRSVLVIGVNASRDVNVGDLVVAAARLVAIEGLNLEQYSIPNGVRLPSLRGATKYQRAVDMPPVTDAEQIWMLPAVQQ